MCGCNECECDRNGAINSVPAGDGTCKPVSLPAHQTRCILSCIRQLLCIYTRYGITKL